MNSRISKIVTAILQSDLALKLVQNETLMRAMLKTFTMSVEARQMVDSRLKTLLASLDLARAEDVEALRMEVHALREALEAARIRAEHATTSDE